MPHYVTLARFEEHGGFFQPEMLKNIHIQSVGISTDITIRSDEPNSETTYNVAAFRAARSRWVIPSRYPSSVSIHCRRQCCPAGVIR